MPASATENVATTVPGRFTTTTAGSGSTPVFAMDGLTDAVGELAGVPIRLGDPFKRVKLGPKITAEDHHGGSLAVAIGLGIED